VKILNHRQLSDQEILARYKQDKNNEWIGILFERYLHLLLGICMKYLKNEEDARDSVQQIFIKVINELPKFEIKHFKGWIYQVAKNYCLMQLRHPEQRNMKELDTAIFHILQEDPGQAIIKDQLLQEVENALTKLNTEQQTCIQLFYLEKKSYQEIAEITGYTILQVKSYLQNGKRNLRLLIEKTINKQE
jgi:RNA polymerase sigma factor (sigma-70 family)